MKSRILRAAVLTALAILAGVLGYYTSQRDSPPLEEPSGLSDNPSPGTPRPDKTRSTPKPIAAKDGKPLPLGSIDTLIEAVFAALANGPDDAALAALKKALLAGDPAKSIAAILTFLESGRDAPTGQTFTLASGGTLDGAPTFRTMLLDVLGQLARTTHSDVAAKQARTLLESKTTADEWVLALRNVAWAEPKAVTYFASKIREMLAYESWRANPSAGMLEAFDVMVFTKDASFTQDLAELQASGKRELQYAAAIALDRLAEQAPLDVMTYLNTHPTTLNEKPMLRADYYAKADLSQIAQRAAIETYLGRPDITDAEKSKLLKALASPATFTSDNLLTAVPVADDGSARRDALGKTVTEWLSNNRFPSLRQPLEELNSRISR